MCYNIREIEFQFFEVGCEIMKNNDSEIGKLIKRKRLENGLTLEQVAKAVGVGKSTVSKWERGAILNMKKDKLDALNRCFQRLL